ncbi:anti-lipopolysaccharide factor-like [Homarus americanus]|uniref:Anti-lipopolysaccharide factor-like 1 n=1 Tax=Homarus americanus TaxID=6706 RepID=A0A8J5N628_HOMAM|nr:anti-lipopolysaccharide factor-like [Homarus americanus]KAG7173665.1 anti-lipopolysaccharide factor-like 1 [Homarus americanus]
MRQCVLLVSVLVVGVLLAPFAPQCHAQGWETLVAGVSSQLVSLWHQGELELMGHYCNFQVKPKIRRWQLYFVGSMWCPGWTNIRGSAQTRSRSGVVGKTTTDFVRKAFRAGLITQQDAQEWLDN